MPNPDALDTVLAQIYQSQPPQPVAEGLRDSLNKGSMGVMRLMNALPAKVEEVGRAMTGAPQADMHTMSPLGAQMAMEELSRRIDARRMDYTPRQGVGGIAQNAGNMVAESIPSMAASFAAAPLVGAMRTKPLLNTAETVLARKLTDFAIASGAITAGQTFQNDQTASGVANAVGQGVLEGVIGRLGGATGVEALFKEHGEQGLKQAIMSLAPEALKESGPEGLTGFTQSVWEQLVKSGTLNASEAIKQGAMGALVGGVMGGAAQIPRIATAATPRPTREHRLLADIATAQIVPPTDAVQPVVSNVGDVATRPSQMSSNAPEILAGLADRAVAMNKMARLVEGSTPLPFTPPERMPEAQPIAIPYEPSLSEIANKVRMDAEIARVTPATASVTAPAQTPIPVEQKQPAFHTAPASVPPVRYDQVSSFSPTPPASEHEASGGVTSEEQSKRAIARARKNAMQRKSIAKPSSSPIAEPVTDTTVVAEAEPKVETPQAKPTPSAANSRQDPQPQVSQQVAPPVQVQQQTQAQQPVKQVEPATPAKESAPSAPPVKKPKATAGDFVRFKDGESLGIDRSELPQVTNANRAKLVKWLRLEMDTDVEPDKVFADDLKPSQSEFSPSKVEEAKRIYSDNIDSAKTDAPVIISADNRIIDGHHRWLAAKEDDRRIKVLRIDDTFDDALTKIRKHPDFKMAETPATKAQPKEPTSATTPPTETPVEIEATAAEAKRIATKAKRDAALKRAKDKIAKGISEMTKPGVMRSGFGPEMNHFVGALIDLVEAGVHSFHDAMLAIKDSAGAMVKRADFHTAMESTWDAIVAKGGPSNNAQARTTSAKDAFGPPEDVSPSIPKDAPVGPEKGQTALGRPELAGIGETDAARRHTNIVDEAIKRVQPVEKQSEEDWISQAREKMSDPAERKRVEEKITSMEVLTPVENKLTQMMLSEMASGIVSTRDPDLRAKHAVLQSLYRKHGSEAGRALAARHDLGKTPEERASEAILHMATDPWGEVKTAIDDLTDKLVTVNGKIAAVETKKGDVSSAELESLKAQKTDLEKRLKDAVEKADNQMSDLTEKLKKDGFDLKKWIDANKDGKKPSKTEVMEMFGAMVRARNTAGIPQVLTTYWINWGLLSAPKTAITNATGVLYGGWNHLVEPFIGAMVRGGATPEAKRMIRGGTNAWRTMLSRGVWSQAFKNAAMSYSLNAPIVELQTRYGTRDRKDLTLLMSLDYQKATKSRFGMTDAGDPANTPTIRSAGWANIPGRALGAVDQMFQTLFAYASVAAEADRIVADRGVPEAQRADAIADLVAQVDSPAWNAAADAAIKSTFNDEPSAIARSIINARNNVDFHGWKPLVIVAPFVGTVDRLLVRGVGLTPLGTLANIARGVKIARKPSSLRTRAEIDALAKGIGTQLVSWSIVALIAANMADDDDIPFVTGSQSIFKGGQEIPAYSLRVGSTWWDYKRVDPFATSLASIVDALQWSKDDGAGMKDALKSAAGILSDKSYMQGITDAVDVVRGKKNLGDWTSSFLASWVPNIYRASASAFTEDAAIDAKFDPNTNEPITHLLERTAQKARLPGIASEEKVDWLGRPIERSTGNIATKLFSPVQPKDYTAGGIDDLIYKWNEDKPAKDRWAPSDAIPRTVEIDGEEVTMTDAEYREMTVEAGKIIAPKLDRIAAASKNGLTEARLKVVKKIVARGRKIARKRISRKVRARIKAGKSR